MGRAVGILLTAQAGAVATALTLPSSVGVVVLLALSLLSSSFAMGTLWLTKKKFQEAVEEQVELRTQDLKEKMMAYEQVAMTDALTGLLNRRGGEEAVTPHIARSRRMKTAMSFVLVDIDNFKKVNDTYGHAVGDRVIEAVARTIRQNLRTTDLAARWGGEELLVCLPDTDLAGAVLVAEKLRQAVALIDLETRHPITASFGCAELGDDDFQVALARADMQMYLAKSQGRNCVCPRI
jgi:diguanylate cyclase (GGDEF)-like protein